MKDYRYKDLDESTNPTAHRTGYWQSTPQELNDIEHLCTNSRMQKAICQRTGERSSGRDGNETGVDGANSAQGPHGCRQVTPQEMDDIERLCGGSWTKEDDSRLRI